MKDTMICAAAAVLLATAGCITLHETEYPAMETTRVPEGKEISVRLSGFKATITEYVPVLGYSTAYVAHGPYRRGGHYTTVSSQTYIPQVRENEAFFVRAQELLEDNGFVLKAATPKYIVDVTFSGPHVSEGELFAEACWMLCSLFSADYGVQTWDAKLRVYDNSTGKVIFHHDYSQRYQVVVWGPLPFISPAASSKNNYNAMQSWCLMSLTDRAVADAAAFLVSR